MHDERRYRPLAGWIPLAVSLTLIIGSPLMFISIAINRGHPTPASALIGGLGILTGFLMLFGFQAIAPNQARVMLLFGNYKGSVTDSGFFWVNPFYSKKKLSLRIRNFETGSITTPARTDAAGKIVESKHRSSGKPSKVNDRDGNPIEISAVVVWRVVNTAEALFEVDDFEDFVAVQSEAALRNLASRHP